MKKLMLGLVVMVVCFVLAVPMVQAGESDEISVTVTVKSFSVSIEPETWAIGEMTSGALVESGLYKARNNGNMPIDVYIGIPEELIGPGRWELGETQGVEVYTMEYNLPYSNNPYRWTKMYPNDRYLVQTGVVGIPSMGGFKLRFGSPTYTELTDEQKINIVVTAELAK